MFLLKDEMKGLTAYDCNIIIDYALKNNCSQKVYDFLLQAFPNKVSILSSFLN